jgi:hypothetical protein
MEYLMTRRASTRSVLIVGVIALMLAGGTAVYSGGWFVPGGPAIQVNATTAGSHTQGRVTLGSDGRFMVVWSSLEPQDANGSEIFGRLLDSRGQPVGAEFHVNTATAGYQDNPQIASDQTGHYVVVWNTHASSNVSAQRYDLAGQPLGGEIPISAVPAGYLDNPNIAMSPGGDFVVVWTQYTSVFDNDLDIWRRRFDSSGGALEPDVLVAKSPDMRQLSPAVSADSTGRFVVVWADSTYSGGLYPHLEGTRFDAAGEPLGTQFQVTPVLGSVGPRTAMTSSGRFVVAWDQEYDGSGNDVFARAFDADALPAGPSVHVPARSPVTGSPGQVDVAIAEDGSFVTSWVEGLTVLVRSFDAAGIPASVPFQVGAGQTFVETTSITRDAAGDYLVVWSDQNNVYARRMLSGGCTTDATDLMVDRSGTTNLLLRWTDAPGAGDHVLLESPSKDGPFRGETVITVPGSTGIVIPMPPTTLSAFYRIVGRSAACGFGP